MIFFSFFNNYFALSWYRSLFFSVLVTDFTFSNEKIGTSVRAGKIFSDLFYILVKFFLNSLSDFVPPFFITAAQL